MKIVMYAKDEFGYEVLWGSDSHPCILPGKTELISIDGEYPGSNYEIGYDINYAASNIVQHLEKLIIRSNSNSDGSIYYYMDATDGLNGVAHIFFYDANDHIVATDRCYFGSASSWDDTFNAPNVEYKYFKIGYTEW